MPTTILFMSEDTLDLGDPLGIRFGQPFCHCITRY
jgi:hypothetical protein